MKSFITSFLILGFSYGHAQQVNAYKYITIKDVFQDFKSDDYQMSLILKTDLRKKNYEILNENGTNIPLELQVNPCLGLVADIKELKAPFQNKLSVELLDCKKNIVGEFIGTSKIKDFKEGYQEALKTALKSLPISKPSDIEKNKISTELITEQPKNSTINQEVSKSDNKIQSKENIYHFDGKEFQLLKDGKRLILIDKLANKISMQLFPTSRENIYHAYVEGKNASYQTIAFVSENLIEVEIQTGLNIWELRSYSK